MKAYHDETVDNVITYIAKRYYDKKNKYIPQMIMYKILAFFDFACLKSQGTPCTELVYNALEFGPVPLDLYNERIKGVGYKIKHSNDDSGAKWFIPVKFPNMDYISENNKKLLDNIIDFIVDKNISANKASKLSHNLPAWQKARERGHNSVMDYADAFDNIFSKNESELTEIEKRYLMYKEVLNVQNRLSLQNKQTI